MESGKGLLAVTTVTNYSTYTFMCDIQEAKWLQVIHVHVPDNYY